MVPVSYAGARIFVGARCREREGELVVGVEWLGSVGRRRDGVRDVVLIGPGECESSAR
jgi:hypothetical protein